MRLFEQARDLLNPSKNPDLEPVFQHQVQHLPTLWLLGKTGAGKSSLIQALTGNSRIDIGNGFQPCTQTAQTYAYPQDKPLLRFLDTRGLAESGYDASEDIAACEHRSHALLIVMQADDPEQSLVLKALKQVKRSGRIQQFLVVHTGLGQLNDPEQRHQAIAHNQAQVEAVMGHELPQVAVELVGDEEGEGRTIGIEKLQNALADLLPIVAHVSQAVEHADQEERNFAVLKTEVLWYAGAAGASDAVPAVGLVAVPAIQAKLLHSLANQYGINWGKKALSEFVGVLGTSFGVQYASRLGVRQLVKLIPVYGQTIGAATAATLSFASTYALGRVACKYLYHQQRGESVNQNELKTLYQQALQQIAEVAKRETTGRTGKKHNPDQ